MQRTHPALRHTSLHLPVWIALIGLLGSGIGCGYQVVGRTSPATASRVRVAVVPFANDTHEADLESLVTTVLRQTLLQSQGFELASAAATPHHLQGIVRRFRRRPLAFDANDNVQQYRLEADILIRLLDTRSQEVRLEQEIPAWAEYLVSTRGVVRENVAAKEAALLRLSQRFAEACVALLSVTLL